MRARLKYEINHPHVISRVSLEALNVQKVEESFCSSNNYLEQMNKIEILGSSLQAPHC